MPWIEIIASLILLVSVILSAVENICVRAAFHKWSISTCGPATNSGWWLAERRAETSSALLACHAGGPSEETELAVRPLSTIAFPARVAGTRPYGNARSSETGASGSRTWRRSFQS